MKFAVCMLIMAIFSLLMSIIRIWQSNDVLVWQYSGLSGLQIPVIIFCIIEIVRLKKGIK